jgi:hypothetical protein
MRNVYHVVPSGDLWLVKHNGAVVSRHYKKEPAIDEAIRIAKTNMPSQVVIHGLDGKIQTEYTYGDDPEKYPG